MIQTLLTFQSDLALALGLAIAAVGTLLLNRLGLLPNKSLPYVVLGIGAAFGLTWFKTHQAQELRKKLKDEEKRLKDLEGHLTDAGAKLGASEARLDQARADYEARRTAIAESIADLDQHHEERLKEITGASGEALDEEMSAMFARLGDKR